MLTLLWNTAHTLLDIRYHVLEIIRFKYCLWNWELEFKVCPEGSSITLNTGSWGEKKIPWTSLSSHWIIYVCVCVCVFRGEKCPLCPLFFQVSLPSPASWKHRAPWEEQYLGIASPLPSCRAQWVPVVAALEAGATSDYMLWCLSYKLNVETDLHSKRKTTLIIITCWVPNEQCQC